MDACPFELERAQEGCGESCCNGEYDARVAFRWLSNALPPFLERTFAADSSPDLRGRLIDDEIGSAERTVWQHEIVAVPAEPGCGPGAWQIAALEIDGGAEIAMQRIGSGAPASELRSKAQQGLPVVLSAHAGEKGGRHWPTM